MALVVVCAGLWWLVWWLFVMVCNGWLHFPSGPIVFFNIESVVDGCE